MKRILFLCSIVIMPVSASFAQTAKPAAATVVTSAMQFNSRINELDASLSRNNEVKAKSVFADIKADIERNLTDSKMALKNVSQTDMPAAMSKYQAKQKNLLEILDLSKDLKQNRAALNTKLKEYYTKF